MTDARLTKTGIGVVDTLPWGTHLCHFYEGKQDLLDVLVPYFKTGLENNELCVWVTAAPLDKPEAREAMKQLIPQFDGYVERGQMEIIPHTDWYLQDGSFSQQRVVDTAGNRIATMANKGYSGLRASGNVGWLQKQGWEDFTRFEEAVDRVIGEHQMIAICSYPLAMCGVRESLDVMKNHRLALVKHEGDWQVIENSVQTRTEEALRDSERRYRLLAENVSDVIWVTDMNLRPIYFSPSVTRLLGYSVEEAMAGTIETRLTSASLEAATDTFARVLAVEEKQPGRASRAGTLELEFRRKDGSRVWADTTVSFLRDTSGRPVEILGVLRDVTERKMAEEGMRDSLQALERTMEDTIQAVASTIETKDLYTAGHQRRVTQLACAIAEEMGLSRDCIRVVRTAGLLHDLGKISLPTDILTKPGRLTEIEMAVIKTHPQVAYDILKNIESFGQMAEVVLQHHERMDGSGYPSGLCGEDILLEARILAVADVTEAMFSHRPYRAALGLDKALEEIERNSGVLYDSGVVSACLRILRDKGFEFTTQEQGDGVRIASRPSDEGRTEGRAGRGGGRPSMRETSGGPRYRGIGDLIRNGKGVTKVRYDLRCRRMAGNARAGDCQDDETTGQPQIEGKIQILNSEASLHSDELYTLRLEEKHERECDLYAKPIDVVTGTYHVKGHVDFLRSPRQR